jgi:hypothetical protein
MKTLLRVALPLAFSLTLAAPAWGQAIDLPRPSPLARVSQMVGLTEISVEYSSPAARGRGIWGGLVPYGKLWRTGANQATKLTVTKDVTIAGKPVPAGGYALFMIPAKGPWTIILNKNPNQGGTNNYQPDLDLVRFQSTPKVVPRRERMTFIFDDTTETSTSLDLEWAGLRVSIPITTNTSPQVAASIKALEDTAGRPFTMAARYLLESKKDYDHALRLVDQSISLREDWLNQWTKAQLLAAKGKKAEACPHAKKAKALGEKAEFFFFADEVKKGLADWRCQ